MNKTNTSKFERKVEIVNFVHKMQRYVPKIDIQTIKTYSGYVGTNCVSAFNPTDIAVDRMGFP